METTKSLNDVQVGDRVVGMGAKRFSDAYKVKQVKRFDPKTLKMVETGGDVVCTYLTGGRFWPMGVGVAKATTITVVVA